MDDVIILRNSPNYKHFLIKLVVVNRSTEREHRGVAYRLDTNDFSGIRWANLTGGRHEIMLSGGPKLTEGENLPKTDVKILQIQKIPRGKIPAYIIILDTDDISSIETAEDS